MKKKDERNLTWKLGELPTGAEIADLVKQEVITKEEARELMFGTAESDKEVIKTLQDQIEFLQDLVKDLSKNRNTVTYLPTYTREIHTTRPYFEKYWMNTSKILGDAGFEVTSGYVQTAESLPNSSTWTDKSPSIMTMSVSPKTTIS